MSNAKAVEVERVEQRLAGPERKQKSLRRRGPAWHDSTKDKDKEYVIRLRCDHCGAFSYLSPQSVEEEQGMIDEVRQAPALHHAKTNDGMHYICGTMMLDRFFRSI